MCVCISEVQIQTKFFISNHQRFGVPPFIKMSDFFELLFEDSCLF